MTFRGIRLSCTAALALECSTRASQLHKSPRSAQPRPHAPRTFDALAEVLALQVFHAADLPIPFTIEARVVDGTAGLLHGSPLHFTTDRECYLRAQDEGITCLSPLEFELLTLALADGCCSRQTARQELARKAHDAGHRLSHQRLLGPVVAPDALGRRWTFGRLCEALGVEGVRMMVSAAHTKVDRR